MRVPFCVFVAWLSLFIATGLPAMALAQPGHVCWVQKVTASATDLGAPPDAVDVYFPDGRLITLVDAGQRRLYVIGQTSTGAGAAGGPETVPFIHAMAGDKLTSFNSPEDVCTMEVVSDFRSVGLWAHASFHPPGVTGSEVTTFIPAVVSMTHPEPRKQSYGRGADGLCRDRSGEVVDKMLCDGPVHIPAFTGEVRATPKPGSPP